MSSRVEVTRLAMLATFAASLSATAMNGCAATGSKVDFTGGASGDGSSSTATSATGTGGAQSTSNAGGSMGVGGFNAGDLDGGDAGDATEELITNPCGSQCGPKELCDTAHLGYDDNCNGLVDEGCSCSPGAVHWCFEGDPSYRHAPGCFDGTETCTELGFWGPCSGGVQAVPPDNCFLNDTSACHAISAVPYATTDLKTGTGDFSLNAIPGSETYTVQCPTGVSQCPAVMPPESFQALQSGEYDITYTKQVAGDAGVLSCTFPLFVGAPGLRVELSWEHPPAPGVSGVDLDLHVHQPVNTDPWSVQGAPQDCTWSSCKYEQISSMLADSPHWFPDGNMIPMPVNWDLQPTLEDNTCYNDPRGVGMEWQQLGMGCHNPRQDVDEIQCDASITDPTNANFCAPENNNIDYPPSAQWVRVGVHYYFNHEMTYDVHPEIKIFCDGALSADLGPHSYYVPEQAVTFEPADGAGGGEGNRFWIAGDVAFTTDSCGVTTCIVQPLYSDSTNKTPLLTLDTGATSVFLPPWPPPP